MRRPQEITSDADAEDTEEDTDHIIEEPVVHQVQKATAPQVITRAKLVSVPKRVPPRLPPRNPNRSGEPLIINADPGASPTIGTDSSTMSPSSPKNLSPVLTDRTPIAPTHNHEKDSRQRVEDSTAEGEVSTTEGDLTTPEERRHNPWAKILEQRSRSDSHKSEKSAKSVESGASNLDIPGGFVSAPTTPEETSHMDLEGEMENVDLDDVKIETGRTATWV